MHQFTWQHGQQSLTWLLHEGLFPLPDDAAAATQARSLALVGRWAFLIAPGRIEPLTADTPLVGGVDVPEAAWSLEWTSRASVRPVPMSLERTRNDEAATPDEGILRLFNHDMVEVPLDEGPVLIGRQQGCHVLASDRRVSAVHCAVHRQGRALRVVDLGSRNGTLINGARIGAALVTREARIEIGHLRFTCRAARDGHEQVALPSEAMARVDLLVRRFAPSDAPVLITGESGVGKELVARRVHALSGRSGPFVALNAAVISPTLAGSELFGHVRGAFTGAEADRDGAFMQAHGGTLFLDEIGELPASVQAELLRVVEQRRVRRLGEADEHPVDVRLVTATHRHLPRMVEQQQFREDLFHRLCVLPIEVPPLRERLDDLEHLAAEFLAKQPRPRRLTAGAWKKLRAHPWPGNVRELLNALKRACVMSDAEELGATDVALAPAPGTLRPLDELISAAVLAAFDANDRSVSATARQLGLQRSTVYRLVKQGGRAGR